MKSVDDVIDTIRDAAPLIETLREQAFERHCVAAWEHLAALRAAAQAMIDDEIEGGDPNGFYGLEPVEWRRSLAYELADPRADDLAKKYVRRDLAKSCTCSRCEETEAGLAQQAAARARLRAELQDQ